MTFDKFKHHCEITFFTQDKAKAFLRYGQNVMNQLYIVWPEKHKEIIGSDYDCFYNDRIVPLTFEQLEQEWKSEET